MQLSSDFSLIILVFSTEISIGILHAQFILFLQINYSGEQERIFDRSLGVEIDPGVFEHPLLLRRLKGRDDKRGIQKE